MMRYEYLDDIMSKANYALDNGEINYKQYESLITLLTNIIKEIYVNEQMLKSKEIK